MSTAIREAECSANSVLAHATVCHQLESPANERGALGIVDHPREKAQGWAPGEAAAGDGLAQPDPRAIRLDVVVELGEAREYVFDEAANLTCPPSVVQSI
jgi:hypothetical protein